jgi:hypothetical protein
MAKIVKQADGHKFKLDEEVYVCKVCKYGYYVLMESMTGW